MTVVFVLVLVFEPRRGFVANWLHRNDLIPELAVPHAHGH
jgi:hypothetical protein